MPLAIGQKFFDDAKTEYENQQTQDWPWALRGNRPTACLKHKDYAPEDIAKFRELNHKRDWKEAHQGVARCSDFICAINLF